MALPHVLELQLAGLLKLSTHPTAIAQRVPILWHQVGRATNPSCGHTFKRRGRWLRFTLDAGAVVFAASRCGLSGTGVPVRHIHPVGHESRDERVGDDHAGSGA
jgi:hypothetical protein